MYSYVCGYMNKRAGFHICLDKGASTAAWTISLAMFQFRIVTSWNRNTATIQVRIAPSWNRDTARQNVPVLFPQAGTVSHAW